MFSIGKIVRSIIGREPSFSRLSNSEANALFSRLCNRAVDLKLSSIALDGIDPELANRSQEAKRLLDIAIAMKGITAVYKEIGSGVFGRSRASVVSMMLEPNSAKV